MPRASCSFLVVSACSDTIPPMAHGPTGAADARQDAPLVSVIVVTYQHERFIRQAIDSILAQQTAFPVEILISEDLSPDRTREMVIDLQRQHPDTIRLFFSDRNQNDNAVTTRAWAAARGRYVALLDGDDYWTDPAKLQTQVDFLEQHPEVVVCGHAVAVVDEDGRERRGSLYGFGEDRYLSREALAEGAGLPTPSVMFRNTGTLPPEPAFSSVFNGDCFLFAWLANFGAGYLSGQVMAVHRWHPGGAWSTLDAAAALNHRNRTLATIPSVMQGSLRSVAYAALLMHGLREDRRVWRRLWQMPTALLLMLVYLRPSSARHLVKAHTRRFQHR